MISVSFFLIFPCATSLSFNFTGFDRNKGQIYFEKDAFVSPDQVIQLTRNLQNAAMNYSWGRATYMKQLHLWDKVSGNLTDFTTSFTFVIDSQKNNRYGDGLAFFLAPNRAQLPSKMTGGSGLGIVSPSQALNTRKNRFVAVEFDTYRNDWDPRYPIKDHVGININSMKSVKNAAWLSNIPEGQTNHASIKYTSGTKNLSVVLRTGRGNTSSIQSLYYIVDLRKYLPEFATVGISAATGRYFEIHGIHSWSFNSTLETLPHPPETGAEIPNPPETVAEPPNLPKIGDENNKGLVVGLGVCAFVVVVGLGGTVFYLCRKKNEGGIEDDNDFDLAMDHEFEKGTGPRKFSFDELALATSNFSEGEKLGEGGFGRVYRGFLRERSSYIAVKRISRRSKQGMKEYASEVKIISRLRHRNLVQLMGWCHKKGELLMVYEFMPNNSLDSCLFEAKTLLRWAMRYKIAVGLALAVLYLHEEWEQCVVHRDIKSSNVMLDSDFNAKLGDFGLARFVDHGKGSQTTVLAGTMGYMAPECFMTSKASKESDVYSFGVVVLEICCGRRSVEPKAKENQIRLVEWVWDLYGVGKLLEAADPRLSADFDEQQMKRLMTVGLWCAHPDCNLRPSIRQAINVLNFEASLPILPSKMPVPMYFSPPVNTPAFWPTTSYNATSTSGIGQTKF
ncbi:hypothetical protein VitviT2T_003900 [Vitis vinifera]|nr:hypothetical protein VitviT2T_003900 [Vitis vinifera]